MPTVERLLHILGLLQTGQYYNSRQLAEQCGVSRRTIFRDLKTLDSSGIDVRYNEKRQGYSLAQTMYVRPTDLTVDEALSLLVLCRHMGDAGSGIPFQRAARSAMLKLLSNLPRKMREDVGELGEHVQVEFDARNPLSQSEGFYELLLQSLAARRRVRITYDSLTEWKEICTLLSPYRLLFSRRSWYVIGRSSLHRQIRTFNVGRIQKAEVVDQFYEIPPRFSLDRYLGNAWNFIREPGKEYDVTVRFQKKVAHNVAEVQWHKTQKLVWNGDTTLDFHVTVASLQEIVWWILGYGDQAEVLKPAKLRKMIRAHADALQTTYASKTRTRKK